MSESGDGGGKLVIIIFGGLGCLVVGLALIGILAALAIPSFVQYMQRAKAAEAIGITSTVADQVSAEYELSCEFPPSLPPTADVDTCCGGELCASDPEAMAVWEEAGLFGLSHEAYFSYETEQIDSSTYEIRAEADFSCGGANHVETIQLTAHGDPPNCRLEQAPRVTTNEFQ